MKLTEQHKKYLLLVYAGMDVSSPLDARFLREIEKEKPEFIEITKVMGSYSVYEHLPYFGAIATAAGVEWALSPPEKDKKIIDPAQRG